MASREIIVLFMSSSSVAFQSYGLFSTVRQTLRPCVALCTACSVMHVPWGGAGGPVALTGVGW